MRTLFVVMAFLLMFGQTAVANDLTDVENLVKEKIGIVVNLLRDKNIDQVTKNRKIVDSLKPVLDFQKMAKLSLGRRYWPKLSKSKKKEFSNLFIDRMQESFLEKLGLYTDEEIVFDKATRKKKKIYVMANLVGKDSKIQMLFKFYKSKKGWKAYDVEIMKISIVQTYRSQFHGVLKKGNIDDLLAKMRKTGQFKLKTEK